MLPPSHLSQPRGSPEDSVFIFDAPNLSDDHVVMFCHMGMPRTQNESTELPLQMQRPHTLRYALTRGSPEDSIFIFDAPNLSDDHVVMFCHMGMPRTQNESTELPLQMQRPHTLRYALTVIGCYFAVTLVLRAHSDDHVVMFCHMGMPRTQNESTELPLQMQRPHTLRYALTVIGCYFAVTLVLRAHNPSGLLYTLFCALILENISVCYQGEGLCADEPR
ncbi:hypothetical protein Tcan_13613 [Toxocara canis]|uniref:Uncharacterized protein n=1 Tax=Toxocara canis TaxID=6265 RepID=A0A0B2VY99_TOXCA|nr:hypothetical protein Tcan_13613 [Toxocara canis]